MAFSHLDKKEQNLANKKALAQRVKRTIESKGWQEIIGPLLDKMIKDTIGGKYGNRWSGGNIQRARDVERLKFHMGYKQSLIDLHNRVYNYLDNIKRLEQQIKDIHKERDAKTQIPMVEEE